VSATPELPLLDDVERGFLDRYVDLLIETFGDELVEISVFGSVAGGESWPRGMPIRSDLDLLVVTDSRVPENVVARLVDATLPLFLESGRQLGPQFKTRAERATPASEREATFLEDLSREAVSIYRR
jgi:predicted nucleotidyltransferase